MTRTFLLRLVCDFIAIGLLMVGLAYYWLGNLAHELAGTGMFLLIIVHNLFNRRWYKTLAPGRPRAGGLINGATIVLLAAAMLVLLLTSLMISRSMFTFLPFSGGFSTRQIHILVAWWALIIVSLHLGMRWAMLMNLARHLCQIHRPARYRRRCCVGSPRSLPFRASAVHSTLVWAPSLRRSFRSIFGTSTNQRSAFSRIYWQSSAFTWHLATMSRGGPTAETDPRHHAGEQP